MKPASPSNLSEQQGHPRERATVNRKPKESSDQSTHARRPIAAVVTTQQSAPDETTEIRKAKSRCGGDGGEHTNQRPRQLNRQGHPRESAVNRKPKESSDQKHPRKAAHSRRSHSQQSAPDETTEIRKAKE